MAGMEENERKGNIQAWTCKNREIWDNEEIEEAY
jgi:hypothetical protein